MVIHRRSPKDCAPNRRSLKDLCPHPPSIHSMFISFCSKHLIPTLSHELLFLDHVWLGENPFHGCKANHLIFLLFIFFWLSFPELRRGLYFSPLLTGFSFVLEYGKWNISLLCCSIRKGRSTERNFEWFSTWLASTLIFFALFFTSPHGWLSL